MKKDISFNDKEVKNAINNLNKQVPKIEHASRVAMLKSGIIIRNTAKSLAPKRTGNLRESGFIVYGGGTGRGALPQIVATSNFDTTEPEGKKVAAEHEPTVNSFAVTNRKTPFSTIGFTAFYALKEHEAVWEDPHDEGESKYLEKSIKQNEKQVVKILTDSVNKELQKKNTQSINKFFNKFTK